MGVLFLFCGLYAAAQQQFSVSGTIQDADTEEAVPMATVSLLGSDSTLITGTTTDLDGGFELMNNKVDDYIRRVQ